MTLVFLIHFQLAQRLAVSPLSIRAIPAQPVPVDPGHRHRLAAAIAMLWARRKFQFHSLGWAAALQRPRH